jgi:hypothetical protein
LQGSGGSVLIIRAISLYFVKNVLDQLEKYYRYGYGENPYLGQTKKSLFGKRK